MGVRPGEYVAVIAGTSAEWHLLEHASLMLGAVVVGIDTQLTPGGMAKILAATRPRAAFVDDAFLNFPFDSIPEQSYVIFQDKRPVGCPRYCIPWIDLQNCNGRSDSSHTLPVQPNQPATLIYTSGTTGAPKALRYTHSQLMLACSAISSAFPANDAKESAMCWLPMSHLFQRMMNLVAVAQGATIYFVNDPKSIAQCIREANPTRLVGVPRFFEKIHAAIDDHILALSPGKRWLVSEAMAASRVIREDTQRGRKSPFGLHVKRSVLDWLVLARMRRLFGARMRYMITGSAPIAASNLEFFADLGIPVYEAYGISECTVPIAANRPTQQRIGSVGVPFEQNEIRIEADGEISIRGPGVFAGYVDAEGNGRCCDPDEFYHTGDLGRFDYDGFLYLQGRKSEMFKTSTGKKVFPSAIEQVYREHPLIDQVVVCGEGRPYLVGLISVDLEHVLRQVGRPESLSRNPVQLHDCELDQLVREAVAKQGRYLAPHERLIRFHIVRQGFDIRAGELTANFKLRRNLISIKYAAEINLMYRSGDEKT